jgi:hypothetical protein
MALDKELLLSFTVLNKEYQNPCLRFIRGLPDASSATPPTVGTLDNPRNSCVPIRSTVADPKICSYIYNGEARFLMAKTVTPESGHDGENTTWSLLAAPTPPYGSWAVLARNIVLQYPSRNGAPVATNPYGIAQTRGLLRMIDQASQKIYTVGTDELNDLDDNSRFTLTHEPFDVAAAIVEAEDEPLPPNAKGQAIISIKDGNGQRYLFVLYNNFSYVKQDEEVIVTHEPGILVRLKVDEDGVITYYGRVTVGKNAVEIIPVTKSNGDVYLLIPAIGGPQQGGATNGESSDLCGIAAFGDWSVGIAPRLLMGDESSDPQNPTYDIRAVAASERVNGIVYILTGIFNSLNYNGFAYKLYKTTVDQLLAAEEATLSEAEEDDILGIAENGSVISPDGTNPYGVFFWDILYETSTDAASDTKDRLHFFKGSALQITPAAAYPSPAPTAIQPPSDDPAPIAGEGYVLYPLGVRDGRIGGYNIDSVDLTAETLRQYKTDVSLKRSARATHITPSSAK